MTQAYTSTFTLAGLYSRSITTGMLRVKAHQYTDDAEIADVAKQYGAEVPFFRSPETSNDFATTADVLREVIGEYEKRRQIFDYFCCLYPTAPFISAEKIRSGFELMRKTDASGAIPVVPFSYPIQRAL